MQQCAQSFLYQVLFVKQNAAASTSLTCWWVRCHKPHLFFDMVTNEGVNQIKQHALNINNDSFAYYICFIGSHILAVIKMFV